MHKDLPSIAIFVAVAQHRGFSKAAKHLGLTSSVISHHVSRIEDSLGVTLFYRSTRHVSLTDQGRALYDVAAGALGDIEEAVVDLTTVSENPTGALQIAMPSYVPDPGLEARIWQFTARYPRISVRIKYSDDRADLITDGFDLAFRVGAMPDSGMTAVKLAEIDMLLVAAPGLLSGLPPLKTPSDLDALDTIDLEQFPPVITLSKGRATRKVNLKRGRVMVDDIRAAHDAAIAGLGLILLPETLCAASLADGRLQTVLPDWKAAPLPLFAVWNNKARRNSLTRRLLDFLGDG